MKGLQLIMLIGTLLMRPRRLAGRASSSINHIFHQADADSLALLGSQQEEDLIVTKNDLFTAKEFTLADAMGVGHIRT